MSCWTVSDISEFGGGDFDGLDFSLQLVVLGDRECGLDEANYGGGFGVYWFDGLCGGVYY